MSRVAVWMVDRHSSQTRKNKINGNVLPYFFHPIQVANLVFKFGAGTDDNMMAALCHDILNDTEITEQELLNATNQNVVNIVKELTYVPSNGTKEQYMLSFETASIEALIIKIADRLCNVADFKLTNPEYARKYFTKANSLFDSFRKRVGEDEILNKYGVNTEYSICTLIEYVKTRVNDDFYSDIIL